MWCWPPRLVECSPCSSTRDRFVLLLSFRARAGHPTARATRATGADGRGRAKMALAQRGEAAKARTGRLLSSSCLRRLSQQRVTRRARPYRNLAASLSLCTCRVARRSRCFRSLNSTRPKHHARSHADQHSSKGRGEGYGCNCGCANPGHPQPTATRNHNALNSSAPEGAAGVGAGVPHSPQRR